MLQQGPSSLPESQANLREYTRRFAEEIRKSGGVPALYMVWPESSRPKAFDAVSQSYAAAANDVNGILFPAGEAWRAAWRRDPKLKLYADDLHPTAAGSYLVALVMYERLYKQIAGRAGRSAYAAKRGAINYRSACRASSNIAGGGRGGQFEIRQAVIV